MAKTIPAYIVYEDDRTLAFLDIVPRVMGHTLVISKYHASTLLELPDKEISPLFAAVKAVAALLKDSLSADGLTIGINQGRASGQEVDHLHVHIMPRFRDDGGGPVQAVVHNPPKESPETIAKKIKNE